MEDGLKPSPLGKQYGYFVSLQEIAILRMFVILYEAAAIILTIRFEFAGILAVVSKFRRK